MTMPEPRNQPIAIAVAAMRPTAEIAVVGKISPAALDLERLLALAQAGDGPAFGEIVARFETMVHGHIFRLTRDAELSRDLGQDVFLQLWRMLPAMTTSASLGTWLKRVAVNAVISQWRQQESQRRRLEAMATAFPVKSPATPAATLIEEEDRDQVRAALEMLPAELHSLLALRIYEDMSYEELSASLGLEVGTVRSRLFRARQMVKDILERWRQHEPRNRRPRAAEF